MYCPSIYLEALTKTNKDIRSSGRDSKRVLHEYSLEPLLLDPVCLACTVTFVGMSKMYSGGNGAFDVWNCHDGDSCSGRLSLTGWARCESGWNLCDRPVQLFVWSTQLLQNLVCKRVMCYSILRRKNA